MIKSRVIHLRHIPQFQLKKRPEYNFESLAVIAFASLISLSSWRGDFEGGDIAAARKSFLSDSPIDIWGGFSGIFYGNLPNSFVSWGMILLALHMILSASGLILIRDFFLAPNSFYSKSLFLISSYLILNFNSFLTRDSTLFSFLLFGFGLWIKGLQDRGRSVSAIYRYSGLTSIVVGCSFRPWISISVAVLILGLGSQFKAKQSKILTTTLFLAIAISPIAVDALSYIGSDLRKVHPELQVISMDAASFACYSNNRATRSKGVEILNAIGPKKYSHSQVCENYQPNTWQSVAFWKLNSEDAEGLGIDVPPNPGNSVEIPTRMAPKKYKETRDLWATTILKDPKSYFQIKVSQLTQIMFAGDSPGIRLSFLIKESQVLGLLKGAVLAPYDLFESLHLMAPIMIIFAGIIYLAFKSRLIAVGLAFGRLEILYLFLFPLSWSIATAIAFIGDNGRYVYPSTLLFLLLLNGFIRTNLRDEEKENFNN